MLAFHIDPPHSLSLSSAYFPLHIKFLGAIMFVCFPNRMLPSLGKQEMTEYGLNFSPWEIPFNLESGTNRYYSFGGGKLQIMFLRY